MEWEDDVLGSEEEAWQAMRAAGVGLAKTIRSGYAMTRFPQSGWRILGLVGKGHNGGDALLAIESLASVPGLVRQATLFVVCSLVELRPHTRKALDLLRERIEPVVLSGGDSDWLAACEESLAQSEFDISVDGLLGMQFRPPLRGSIAELIPLAQRCARVRLRVAVDLPSGVGDEGVDGPLQADVTCATGILKSPLLDCPSAGALRYLDLGFFRANRATDLRVLRDRILDPLRGIRPARSEKRQHGHLAILAGSRSMPGALSLCVQAALRSGVGLVTVFAPESIAGSLAATLPEAMWRSWPETPQGGLALEGLWQIRSMEGKATALLMGPGMGAERETQTLLETIAAEWRKSLVLDADALRPEVVAAFSSGDGEGLLLTPHDGEFARLSGASDSSDAAVKAYARETGSILVKKGSSTRISDGAYVFLNTTGNAVLSRGGSGDLLAGLAAGLLAQDPSDPLLAACKGVYWHGRAADLLAQDRGQTAVRTTELLDFLSAALQDDG